MAADADWISVTSEETQSSGFKKSQSYKRSANQPSSTSTPKENIIFIFLDSKQTCPLLLIEKLFLSFNIVHYKIITENTVQNKSAETFKIHRELSPNTK